MPTKRPSSIGCDPGFFVLVDSVIGKSDRARPTGTDERLHEGWLDALIDKTV